MDITNKDKVVEKICGSKVDAVIHCAAYTAVDSAEENKDLCRKINKNGTENIVNVCKDLNIKMLYISTDYVFDGKGARPWETDDERDPLNVYGLTKYEGEVAVQNALKKYFIVRISWVFGINGNNFIKTMLKLGEERDEISVVDDQYGSPTYTSDLATLLIDMIQTEKYGIYHATNEGVCTWYEFAIEIFKQAEIGVNVKPVSSEKYLTKAVRPQNSRMSKEKLVQNGFTKLPNWKDALQRYLIELGRISSNGKN